MVVNNLSVIVINFDFKVFVYMFVVHDFGLFQIYAEVNFEACFVYFFEHLLKLSWRVGKDDNIIGKSEVVEKLPVNSDALFIVGSRKLFRDML